MPKKIEKILKRMAERRGLQKGSARYNAYVYGTMQRIKARSGSHGK